ncbi:MAG: gentisate 1,2-dioxygenase [Burkholderiales bacterium]|nr:gentisate 1,2-dioxygenase [Burkholderiales bacterium]MDE2277570.1 gentisate 1,2-dioxygenase [Burkholderiales bacterium]
MDSASGILPSVDLAAEVGRSDFYQRAGQQHLAPLWRVLHGLVTDEPVPRCVPALWRYAQVRPFLLEACSLISTAEAERRVLVLENPGLPGASRITQSLFAGLQVILPGEVAPAHRHVASALRFIIEGRDAFTAVAGEKTTMRPGDFVITPSMTWHDHGHEGSGPMVWLDGLDMHIVNLLGASFREGYPGQVHPQSRPEGAAMAEAGCNLLPVDQAYGSQTSPIFNYPYDRTREALHRLSRFREINAWHGHKMRYVNPVTGGWAMPTMATWMQLLPQGFESRPYRATDSTVFVVVEGRGSSRVGDRVFEWAPHDVFVVPSWVPVQHSGRDDAVLFSYSDRAVQEKLDLLREEKL